MKITIETDRGQLFRCEIPVRTELYELPQQDGVPAVVQGVIDWAQSKILNMQKDLTKTPKIELLLREAK